MPAVYPALVPVIVLLGTFLVLGVGAVLLIFGCAIYDAWVARRKRGERGWP